MQVPPKKTHLAIGLFTGSHSQMVTYAFIQTRGDEIVGSRVVQEREFMYAAMGYWPCLANPNKINLFEANGVDSCFLLYNDAGKVDGWYSKPFQNLWKVRFYEHPYQYDQMGWSQGQYKPSLYQLEYIYKRYGVKNVLTEYFYGDTLYKLLRDVQDAGWVSEYRYVSADTTQGP